MRPGPVSSFNFPFLPSNNSRQTRIRTRPQRKTPNLPIPQNKRTEMRRRLRLQVSDDEDDDEQNPGSHQHPSIIPLEISSDEEFVEARNSFSPPLPEPDDQSSRDWSPIDVYLRNLGLGLKREWIGSCVRSVRGDVPGFDSMDVSGKARICFERFLVEDMNHCGSGVLPENVQGLHNVELKGPFVLQVDEMVNTCAPLPERYNGTPPGFKRCLKLSLTDGAQRVYGMEYRTMSELQVLANAGLKVAICNVLVRRGLLILVPEVLNILGGLVENLEMARTRLVIEIKKPPRGRRNQTVLSLSERAYRAAWPSNLADNDEEMNDAVPEGTFHPQPNPPVAFSTPGIDAGRVPAREFSNIHTRGPVEDDMTRRGPAHFVRSIGTEDFAESPSEGTNSLESIIPSTRENTSPCTGVRRYTNDFSASLIGRRASVEFSNQIEEPPVPSGRINTLEEPDLDNCRPDAEASYSMHDVYHDEDNLNGRSTEIELDDPSDRINTLEESDLANNRQEVVSSCSTHAVYAGEDVNNGGDGERPIILEGKNLIPFTYLSLLLTKYAFEGNKQAIQGNIKCFLTGVKKFQFRDRSTFELCVYVDDGSHINEVLVDHNFVHKTIGHSPMEVTTALSSPDKKMVSNMKETMMEFQKFLVNFEGTIFVEINEDERLPIARVLRQGCSASDGWLLLRRLKSLTAPRTIENHFPSIIELSP